MMEIIGQDIKHRSKPPTTARKPSSASLPPKTGREGWSVKIIEPSKSQAGGGERKKKELQNMIALAAGQNINCLGL